MNVLRVPQSSTIRHHIRAQISRLSPLFFSLAHQSTTILLLLPILAFLSLYVYNHRQSARIKTELAYEQIVWPADFGFPEWYGDPRVRDRAGAQRTGDLVPWASEKVDPVEGTSRKRIRLLGILPANFKQHEQAVFLHHLGNIGSQVGLDVTIRESHDRVAEADECWDWIWTFGAFTQSHEWSEGCKPIIINEPDLKSPGLDLAAEITSNITLLTEATNAHIRYILKLLYADSFKYTTNPPLLPNADGVGLIHHSTPSADPYTFFPDKGMTGWKRKRVTLFVGADKQRRITDELGRRDVLKEYLPSGWTVFFERDPLEQPTIWRSFFRNAPTVDWTHVVDQRLKYDKHLAKTMRQSGICVFDDEWTSGVLSYRMVQAMLSGCVVATVTPSTYRKAFPQFVIPLDPLKPSSASAHVKTNTQTHHYVRSEFLPQLVQISGIISAYSANKSGAGGGAGEGGGTLEEKALWAFMFARERFTTRRKAGEVAAVVRTWQEGGRGLQLPGGYYDAV